MDRLETSSISHDFGLYPLFTFQYGQIRNTAIRVQRGGRNLIYIPVWIDQKRQATTYQDIQSTDLHSSMDRLETLLGVQRGTSPSKFTFQYGQIRNLDISHFRKVSYQNLHSSMDRLETYSRLYRRSLKKLFTFQYGQIRNYTILKIKNRRRKIYIPVWIDQKLVFFQVQAL